MKKVMSDSWERKYTDEFRERKVLSILPFIVVSGENGDFHWTGKWFKFVTIKEQKVKDRYLEFDDGWSYQHYWGRWKTGWVMLKFVEDEKIS
jgi:hypothetical protein